MRVSAPLIDPVPVPPSVRRLVLAGGGHAHLSVLRALAKARPVGVEVVLVTPVARQLYSGMLPGWMAGHYAASQCQVGLAALATAAGVRLLLDQVIAVDAGRRHVFTAAGARLEFDFLSLDVGSETDLSSLASAGARLLAVKPLGAFFAAWPAVVAAAAARPGYRLAVVGGGAAAVELALAARQAFANAGAVASVSLVASSAGPLADHGACVQQRVLGALRRAGVSLYRRRGAGAREGLLLSDGALLRADCVLAATGARAPSWLRLSQLALDERGFVAVDACHRSVSHPYVLAAGDVCSRQDAALGRSGVHAVHAGPVLAANLLALLEGRRLRPYRARRRSLYLLACGPRYAIASWGGISFEGRWLWRCKDWIDRRFIRRFGLAAPIAPGV